MEWCLKLSVPIVDEAMPHKTDQTSAAWELPETEKQKAPTAIATIIRGHPIWSVVA